MSVFRSRGFDSLIGKGTVFNGAITIASGSTLVVDGEAQCSAIVGALVDKVSVKTTLMVNGVIGGTQITPAPLELNVHNIIITGKVECGEIRVEGTLAVKSGAHLRADRIYYRELVIETGAVVHGQMFHLDYVSTGELV